MPVIPPLLELKPGETRHLTVDTSGVVYDKWAQDVEQRGIWARAIVGHMYALHVKNSESDFYVLFRVESIERGDNCTISWRRVRSPKV